MTQVKTRYRKDPQPVTVIKRVQRHRNLPTGAVLEVRLQADCFAYVCVIDETYGWLFDFVSSRPLLDGSLLTLRRWKLPFAAWKEFPTCWPVVTLMKLSHKEQKIPSMWVQISEENVEFYQLPTCYQVYSPKTDPIYDPYYYITEAETHVVPPHRSVYGDNLVEFITPFLPELERIEIPDAGAGEQVLVSQLKPSTAPEAEPVLIEVHFFATPETMGLTPDAMGEELGDALENQELGLLMTVDSGNGTLGSEFEVVLEVRPKRIKGALTQIRKTLKRLKAPASTRILEVTETGNIEHPLVAAAQRK